MTESVPESPSRAWSGSPMSTPTEEVTVDFDAIDAEVAKGKANGAAASDPNTVVVETATPEPAKPDKPTLSTEEGIEKLKKQLAEEKSRREAAESRANEAAHSEAEARGKVQTSQLDQIKSAIAQITQAKDVLKTKYADAAAAGDWGAASEVQSQMADNAADLRDLKKAETTLENAPKPTARAPVDKVEHFAAQLSPQSGAWVRAHPEFVNDNHKNQQMLAAHQLAVARGLKADTPEYFASIEKTLDITGTVAKVDLPGDDPVDDPMAAAAKPINGSGRQAAPAAPVSRSGNGAGNRPNVVKLTPAQVEAAGNMGMTVEEYAKQVVALRKEGKLS